MALSAKDQAAVLAAAQQGGLSSAQGQTVVNEANAAGNTGTIVNPNTHQVITQMTPDAPTATSGDSYTYSTTTGRYYKNGNYTTDYGLGQIDTNLGHLIGSSGDQTAGGKIQIIGDLPTTAQQNGNVPQPTQVSQTAQQQVQATQQAQQTQQTATQNQQASQAVINPLAMPANGSVVDLLNSVGADSSIAARSALAAQYGIQGYSGTAAQNQELAKKYLDTYNQTKGTAVPQNAADARSAIQALQGDQNPATQNPVASFYDSYGSMDPVMKSIYDQINQINSYLNDKTSIQDEISKLPEFKERNDVKADLLDVKRVMDGTEDDIRDEINNAGGFATESQVQALTGARNKVLLKKANALTDQFNVLNDYVNQITDLTKANREEVMQNMQTKLGLTKTLFDMNQTMTNAAKDNYKMIVDSVGWQGLAASVQGNPAQVAKIENLFGMAPGELMALASYQPPSDNKFQFVPGNDYQDSGVFDPKTGQFAPYGGGGGSDPVSAAMGAIVGTESGGNYNAVSPVIVSGAHKGEQSYGKYQVLASNIPTWTKEAGLGAMTPQQFLASPEAQEAVAKNRFQQMWDKYGNIEDVASVWFTGRPYAQAVADGAKDATTGMTVQQYVANAKRDFTAASGGTSTKGPTQIVDVNGKKVLINSKTGAIVSDISGNFAPDKSLQLAQAQQSIQDISSLATAAGLAGAVGPNPLARSAPDFDFFTGVRGNFIAGVEQIRGQLTMDKLIQAKSNGATFGALSDSEQQLLAASASKLGTWAIKNSAGNVIGYNTTDVAMKKELDKIKFYGALDYVLKGGTPESIGAQLMQDGHYWIQNSDGTLSKLK